MYARLSVTIDLVHRSRTFIPEFNKSSVTHKINTFHPMTGLKTNMGGYLAPLIPDPRLKDYGGVIDEIQLRPYLTVRTQQQLVFFG